MTVATATRPATLRAMLAPRHPLAWAFAGGCLSGAVVLGVVLETSRGPSRDMPSLRAPEPSHERRATDHVEEELEAARVADLARARPAAQKPAERHPEPSPEPGSSVADILTGLESAYREALASNPPHTTTKSAQPAVPDHAAQDPAAVVAVAPSAQDEARPASVTQSAVATVVTVAPAPAPETDTRPRLASRDESRPRDVYLGEVHQNTNVGTVNEGNVHQGDIYVVQGSTSYVPYVAVPPYGYVSPSYAPRSKRYVVPDVPLPSTFGTRSGPSPFKYPVDLVH